MAFFIIFPIPRTGSSSFSPYEIAINWTDGMMDLSTGHGQPQTQGAQQILGVALGGGKNGSYGLRMVYMCL